MILRFAVILLIAFACLFFQSCGHKDISYVEPYKQELGKQYEIKKPLFVITRDHRSYRLQEPGHVNYVPYTIEEYRSAPRAWWTQPQWKEAFPRLTPEQAEAYATHILGVVEAGTVIEVTRLTAFHASGMGWFYRPIVRIHDPRFCDLEVSASFLLSGEYNHDNIYRPFDPEYVRLLEPAP
ncbi:MAG: hypothetical protein JSR80_03345 [Verrucomicrobia bacterium]|nr:hypothetical protein [Verrucomicrobiota bacterium]